MGQARVLLTKQDNFYYVLTYSNSEENSSLKTCFPYANGEQEKTLKKPKEFYVHVKWLTFPEDLDDVPPENNKSIPYKDIRLDSVVEKAEVEEALKHNAELRDIYPDYNWTNIDIDDLDD